MLIPMGLVRMDETEAFAASVPHTIYIIEIHFLTPMELERIAYTFSPISITNLFC